MAATVTRWWWIRHAPVTSDDGRIYGQVDMPADLSERCYYKPLARALPGESVLITSHLQRTHQTADALRDAGVTLGDAVICHAFAEQNFGEWQGRVRTEIYEKYGADHGFWLAPAEHAPPGGESFADVMERVAGAIDEFNRVYAGSDIVAVAHGGSIRAALGHALGLPAARAIAFAVENCSLTRLDHIAADGVTPAWRVVSVNMTPWE